MEIDFGFFLKLFLNYMLEKVGYSLCDLKEKKEKISFILESHSNSIFSGGRRGVITLLG
jgi:hypothetical protein